MQLGVLSHEYPGFVIDSVGCGRFLFISLVIDSVGCGRFLFTLSLSNFDFAIAKYYQFNLIQFDSY